MILGASSKLSLIDVPAYLVIGMILSRHIFKQLTSPLRALSMITSTIAWEFSPKTPLAKAVYLLTLPMGLPLGLPETPFLN